MVAGNILFETVATTQHHVSSPPVCKLSCPSMFKSHIYNIDKCLPAIYKQHAKINIIYTLIKMKQALQNPDAYHKTNRPQINS
jgi:hypothetical protein